VAWARETYGNASVAADAREACRRNSRREKEEGFMERY
jgi:hypothetical protein